MAKIIKPKGVENEDSLKKAQETSAKLMKLLADNDMTMIIDHNIKIVPRQ